MNGGNMFTKRLVITVCLMFLALSGCQTQLSTPLEPARYDEDSDVYIVFQGEHFEDETAFVPIDMLGELAFELQEGTHSSLTDVSGAEVDHYYIWVCSGEQCIPVDPLRIGMSR